MTDAGVNALGPGVNGAGKTALAVLRAALHSFMFARRLRSMTAGALSLPPMAEVELFAPWFPCKNGCICRF